VETSDSSCVHLDVMEVAMRLSWRPFEMSNLMFTFIAWQLAHFFGRFFKFQLVRDVQCGGGLD